MTTELIVRIKAPFTLLRQSEKKVRRVCWCDQRLWTWMERWRPLLLGCSWRQLSRPWKQLHYWCNGGRWEGTFKAVGAGTKDKDKEPEDIAAGQLMGIPEKPAEKPKAKDQEVKTTTRIIEFVWDVISQYIPQQILICSVAPPDMTAH